MKFFLSEDIMLFISGSNGNLKVQSLAHNQNKDSKLIILQADSVTRIGSATMFEEELITMRCKDLSFAGQIVSSIEPTCPFELYTIEGTEGFVLFELESKSAFISESLSYINRMISSEQYNVLEILIKHGFQPISINLNNLLLRQPLDTSKLNDTTHCIFDFQWGDNETLYTINAVVESDSLENRLNGKLFIKKGVITSVGEFETFYIAPNYLVEHLDEAEAARIGAIYIKNFNYNKASLLLVPMLFKSIEEFKAFESMMKAQGRSTVTISRQSIHGFNVQTVIDIPLSGDTIETEATVRELVICPTTYAPTLLVNEFNV